MTPTAPDARRLEAWAGEVRINLIRLAALVGFYGYHLVNVYAYRDDPTLTPQFHARATALVLAWAGGVVLLHTLLARRRLPAWLPYAAALGDAALVTAMLLLAGPRSPLVVLYWLVIATTPLRLSVGVVWAATLAALAGYLIVLGHYAFVEIGAERYYGTPGLRVPRTQQVVVLLGLAAAGLLAGQAVRQSRRLLTRAHPLPRPEVSP